MVIHKVKDKSKIEYLYKGWQETMIYSYLDGYMGVCYATDDNQSAIIVVADFCFLAGLPSKELLENKVWGEFAIMVPQTDQWNTIIEEVYQDSVKRERYATSKGIHYFDIGYLKDNVMNLSDLYEIKQIDETLYHQLLSQSWSYDLCGQYQTFQEFQKMGIGFVIVEGHEIVAGISSYTVYNGGIEIEIDTRKDKRRQGLARICASQMILECLDKNLYPSWDAHNQASLELAESLGYVFDKSYFVYEVIDK